MPELALAVTQRDSIQDPAVIEELDRAFARLNAHLKGLGQVDAEANLQDGNDTGGGVQVTSFADLSGPFILPVKKISLSSDIDALDPGESSILRIVPVDADRTINGIKGGIDGRVLKIYVPRSASQALTLAHQAAAAQADHRVDLIGAANLSSVAGEARGWSLVYDATDKSWVQDGGSAAIAAAALSALDHSGTQVGTDADTNEKDLWVGSVPANTLAADGDVVHVRASGNFANNAQGKQLRFYFDGTVVVATGAQSWQDRGWQLHAMILRRGAASQVIHAQFIPAITGTSASIGEIVTDTADETGAISFKITGQNSVATANDITFESGHAFKVGAS